MTIDPFLSLNLAVILLILGKLVTMRLEILRRYAIPEPVVGGFLCIALVALIYGIGAGELRFSLGMRDFLLLIFFAGIGLKADIRTLLQGGKPLLMLLALSGGFVVLQNLAGMGMAGLFGFDPLAGLMLGSISLTGGVGTSLAWAPILEAEGVAGALDLGLAANTVGLIAACVMGGPLAAFLIRRHRLEPRMDRDLDIGVVHEKVRPRLDYFAFLWAVLILNVTVMLGTLLADAIALTGLTLPPFVSCLLAGIALSNTIGPRLGPQLRRHWPAVDDALALISDLALGLFLVMALMGLQIWTLGSAFAFIAATLLLQILLVLGFTLFIVFRAMGGDYEASVISAGFSGITLGSTATAIASMTAVAQQHGAAHRAFLIVPLVAGFFIDLWNALVISVLIAL